MTCAIYLRLYEKIFEPLCVWRVWLPICDLRVEIKQMNFRNKTPLSSGSVLEEIVVIPRMLTSSPDPAAHREILPTIPNAESAPVILPGNFVTRTRQRIGHVESSRLSKEAFARLWANRVYNLIARHPAPSHSPVKYSSRFKAAFESLNKSKEAIFLSRIAENLVSFFVGSLSSTSSLSSSSLYRPCDLENDAFAPKRSQRGSDEIPAAKFRVRVELAIRRIFTGLRDLKKFYLQHLKR